MRITLRINTPGDGGMDPKGQSGGTPTWTPMDQACLVDEHPRQC